MQYIYCPISQENKGNQKMKFGQLIEYNMRNPFLEKSYSKYDGETVTRQNCAYLWISSLKLNAVCSYCVPSWGLSKYIETELQITCFYPIWSIFSQDKNLKNLENEKSLWVEIKNSFHYFQRAFIQTRK